MKTYFNEVKTYKNSEIFRNLTETTSEFEYQLELANNNFNRIVNEGILFLNESIILEKSETNTKDTFKKKFAEIIAKILTWILDMAQKLAMWGKKREVNSKRMTENLKKYAKENRDFLMDAKLNLDEPITIHAYGRMLEGKKLKTLAIQDTMISPADALRTISKLAPGDIMVTLEKRVNIIEPAKAMGNALTVDRALKQLDKRTDEAKKDLDRLKSEANSAKKSNNKEELVKIKDLQKKIKYDLKAIANIDTVIKVIGLDALRVMQAAVKIKKEETSGMETGVSTTGEK